MKKLLILTIIIVGVCFAVVEWKFKSGSSSQTTSQQQTQESSSEKDQADQAPDQTTQPDKHVVSDDELQRLKSQNLVSSDQNYYIKAGTPFPSIVDLHTGSVYQFKPAANYTQVSNLQWSPDGQLLSYLYRVGDDAYAGHDLLDTATIGNVLNQKFPNAARVLSSGDKMDYVWLSANQILFYQLLVYDYNNRYYSNGNIGIYNATTEQFTSPWLDSDGKVSYIPNVYSMQIAPTKDAVLATQAVLDNNGNTTGQEYVVRDLAGNLLNTSNSYDPNWYK